MQCVVCMCEVSGCVQKSLAPVIGWGFISQHCFLYQSLDEETMSSCLATGSADAVREICKWCIRTKACLQFLQTGLLSVLCSFPSCFDIVLKLALCCANGTVPFKPGLISMKSSVFSLNISQLFLSRLFTTKNEFYGSAIECDMVVALCIAVALLKTLNVYEDCGFWSFCANVHSSCCSFQY